MTALLLYIIKSTLYLTVFYSFFMLVMRKTTFFRLNRVVFIAGTCICMLMPFIDISLPHNIESRMPMGVIEAVLTNSSSESVALEGTVVTDEGAESGMGVPLIEIIFFAGALVSFFITARSYWLMRRMILSVQDKVIDGVHVKVTEADIPSFSWGRHIVISSRDLEENPAILTHEHMHVKSGHSIDLMAYSIVTTLHWFNPLVWIARTELKMLHEYEADNLTINKGIDATQYQLLLVKKAVGAKRFQLANGFNHSKLKNRITMMHKNKTNKWTRLAYLVCIPAMALTMCFCSQPKGKQMTFDKVDVKPTFNGGDANTFSKWVNSELVYPEECKENGISGRVTLGFTIGTDGKVSDVKVLKGVDEKLDAEAVRVLKMSPDWTPGMHEGKAVPVSFTFPIIFVLRGDDEGDAMQYQQVDVKPTFDGGDANKFAQWVGSQIQYPEECKKDGTAGRVVLSFTIGTDGKVSDVKVLRGIHEKLDAEALRVISMSPDWAPGMHEGKAVPVSFTIPVVFKAN